MSFRDENEESRDLRKPFLHTGSWYRMGSRQSSMLGSSQAIRDSSISVVACVLIVALGPIQFGFTVSYSFASFDLFNVVFFCFCLCFLFDFEFPRVVIPRQHNQQSPRILDLQSRRFESQLLRIMFMHMRNKKCVVLIF